MLKYYRLLLIALVGIVIFTVALRSTRIQQFQGHLSDAWYPQDTASLQETLRTLDHSADTSYSIPSPLSDIKGAIVPHAGYRYSGDVAASVFRLIAQNKNIKRIVLLAPSHRYTLSSIALCSFQKYNTPIGSVFIDQDLTTTLLHNDLFSINDEVFSIEHSIEVQLPFIAHYYHSSVQILPCIVGQLSKEQLDEAARIFAPYFQDPQTLFIATSDFTHFGAQYKWTPFTKHIKQNIQKLDSRAFTFIRERNEEAFFHFAQTENPTICGNKPIVLLLALLNNDPTTQNRYVPELIAYKRSGDITKDYTTSVSYFGIILTTDYKEDQFTQYEKTMLKNLSYETLHTLFSNDPPPLIPIKTTRLLEKRGSFITLTKKENLRGCIGRITSLDPLYKTMIAMTRASALHDTRFSPVTAEELDAITVKISVLTAPQPVSSPDDIIIGKHGIIFKKENKSAVYLPSVAVDQGWNREQTLSSLSEKAGLAKDAWKEGGTFAVFESIDF